MKKKKKSTQMSTYNVYHCNGDGSVDILNKIKSA